MEFVRKNGFVLDFLEGSFDQEFYEGEEITSKVIMKVKQEIAEEIGRASCRERVWHCV